MQCVLMLNFINEKIYTFLWFWIVFVAIASTFSAIRYTVALVLPMYRGLMADNFLPVSLSRDKSDLIGDKVGHHSCQLRFIYSIQKSRG